MLKVTFTKKMKKTLLQWLTTGEADIEQVYNFLWEGMLRGTDYEELKEYWNKIEERKRRRKEI